MKEYKERVKQLKKDIELKKVSDVGCMSTLSHPPRLEAAGCPIDTTTETDIRGTVQTKTADQRDGETATQHHTPSTETQRVG